MVIIMAPEATDNQLQRVVGRIEAAGFKTSISRGGSRTLIGIIGDRRRIATLPIGYADGWTRLLSGRTAVLIHGCRAPLVGKICMDQCMVYVTDIKDAHVGDAVTLFGSPTLTADEAAGWIGTINYEVVCMISPRMPRVYTDDSLKA